MVIFGLFMKEIWLNNKLDKDGKDYLIGEFSAADCMLGHSCYMANRLGCVSDEMANVKKYVSNIESREAFQKAIKLGNEAGNPIG